MELNTKEVPFEKYVPIGDVKDVLKMVGFKGLNDKRIKAYKKDGRIVVCLDDLRRAYNAMAEIITDWREDEEFWS